jgi:predicted phage baseplate assembly protein
MPIEDYLPRIDDRRYDDIVAEIRTRIARYTPEWTPVWTDVNESDPGITLAQVFAWLSDMLLYRMGQVPELNYLKFLELLGIDLNPAEPAQVEVTFPVKETYPAPSLIVPHRCQISAESKEGGIPIIFETERALIALTPRLASVQAFDGYSFSDVSLENESAAQGFQPFGPRPRKEAALLLGFTYGGEFPDTEIDLGVWTFQEGPIITSLQCGLPPTPAYGPARIRWEYWDGTQWQGLKLLKDETLTLTRSGHIHLKTSLKSPMQRAIIGEVADERYWLRGRLEQSQYEQPPELLSIRTNTVAAIQAETIRDEVLRGSQGGGSNGRRDQVFRLASTPVLHDSLTLEVDEGDNYQPWTEVDDFFGSNPDDRHFVLNRTTGEIRFGDGVNGHIPVANPDNPDANVVAREYRAGGGKCGNLPAGAVKTLITMIDGVDDNAIHNLLATHSGRDEETIDAAKKRAPSTIKSRCRAVTADDFKYLAMQAANVKRAEALPLFHPDFPGVQVPGTVTVIVVPEADVPNPLPSEGTLRTVCAYLEQRRLLTTELYVTKPTYQLVEVQGGVVAEDDADSAEVSKSIEQMLLGYLHPLKGGEDRLGWPFGGTIFYSRVYQRVSAVAGVQSIQHLVILLDGEKQEAYQDVRLQKGALVYSTQHNVQVNYNYYQ